MKSWIPTFVLCLTAVAVHASDSAAQGDVKNPELRSELLQRMKIDQAARDGIVQWQNKRGLILDGNSDKLSEEQKAKFAEISSAIEKADRENTAWLRMIIETRGWPTKTLVGSDGAAAAWLLVQHADANPDFQRACLDLMTKLPQGEVSKNNLAYLTDRVLLAEGKKQIFGTQLNVMDGKLRPRPMEDEGNVDQRRADVGLPPIAEYIKEAEKIYGFRPK